MLEELFERKKKKKHNLPPVCMLSLSTDYRFIQKRRADFSSPVGTKPAQGYCSDRVQIRVEAVQPQVE